MTQGLAHRVATRAKSLAECRLGGQPGANWVFLPLNCVPKLAGDVTCVHGSNAPGEC